MPQEAHLGAGGQAAAARVRLHPRLVWAEDDPDPARPVTGLVAGCLTIGKAPPVATDKRLDGFQIPSRKPRDLNTSLIGRYIARALNTVAFLKA
jgi:hypothetical protein